MKMEFQMLGFVSNTKQKMFIYSFFKEEEIVKKPNVHVKATTLDWDVFVKNYKPLDLKVAITYKTCCHWITSIGNSIDETFCDKF